MPKKSKETKPDAADDKASVFCRMTASERELIERALAKRQAEIPEANWLIGKIMVVLAVRWAKDVLGEK